MFTFYYFTSLGGSIVFLSLGQMRESQIGERSTMANIGKFGCLPLILSLVAGLLTCDSTPWQCVSGLRVIMPHLCEYKYMPGMEQKK